MTPLENVALAPKTSLQLGGPARYFVTAEDDATVAEALRWAKARGVNARLLGGGSNLVIDDAGFDGLVIEMAQDDVQIDGARVTAAAGVEWDLLVARVSALGLAGLECLSGIPGRVGATPIQNVGAYGQEVCQTISQVRVLERATLEEKILRPEQCEFSYRDSFFKRNPEQYVVLGVTFELTPGGAPALRYGELSRAVEAEREAGGDVGLTTVREIVIGLRRRKSMVLDPDDPNTRCAGSFFTNPFVSPELAARVEASAPGVKMPRWPSDDGRVKLAAGWLIEQAGMHKGLRRGAVGISGAHTLALVHHGGGSTKALLALAEEVKAAVFARFGVTLQREPVRWD